MFLGHFAVAFGAKKVDPGVSLGACFAAAQLPDVIWPLLILTGVERVSIAPGDTAVTPLRFEHYPFSHSLLAVALWAGAFAAVHYVKRRRARAARALAALVLSHWVLDALSHRPDMPLVPGYPTVVGFGLWRSVPATLAVETVMYLAGVALYLGVTRAKHKVGRYGLAGLVAFLTTVYMANLFGPPPPDVRTVAVAGIVGAIILLVGAEWVDRHREPTAA